MTKLCKRFGIYSQGMQLVDDLIESMPRRVQAVFEANGG